jgi:hypothetical protein
MKTSSSTVAPLTWACRSDKDGIADPDGVPGSAADHGVLHDDDVGAEPDFPVLGGQDGAVEEAGPFPEGDGATEGG